MSPFASASIHRPARLTPSLMTDSGRPRYDDTGRPGICICSTRPIWTSSRGGRSLPGRMHESPALTRFVISPHWFRTPITRRFEYRGRHSRSRLTLFGSPNKGLMQSKLRAPGQPRRSSVCTERLRSGCPTPFSGSTGVSVPWIATDTVAAKPCRRLNTGYHLDDYALSSNRSRLLQAAPISSDPNDTDESRSLLSASADRARSWTED